MILVTGGVGFIGGNFVLNWGANDFGAVVNLDKRLYKTTDYWYPQYERRLLASAYAYE
jgi:dTDP-D-glucose 4,6-dehydratase